MEKMEILEEKIRKATELIRSLRDERDILEDRLSSSREEVRRLSAQEPNPDLTGTIDRLTEEREVLAQRIESMINIIDEVEAS